MADLLDQLPFKAALALAGEDEQSATAAALGVRETDIDLAVESFRLALKKKVLSPKQALPPGNSSGIMERGDEAECAEWLLAGLGTAADVAFDEGVLYHCESGLWRRLDHDFLLDRQRQAAGTPVLAARGTRPLRVSYMAARGAVSLAYAAASKEAFFAGAPDGVAFSNGFVRVEDGKLVVEPLTRDHRARHAYEFPFTPGLTPPLLQEFFRSIWPDDYQAKGEVYRQYLGLANLGLGAKSKRLLVLLGGPNTGKSTLLNATRAFCPDGSVSSTPPGMFDRDTGLATLRGKLMNLVSECPENDWLDPSALKKLTGDDMLTARRLYKDPFEFRARAGHILAANMLPRINDRSGATQKRLLVLHCDNRVSLGGDEPGVPTADPTLAQRLSAERHLVVPWALEGALTAIANGLALPDLPSSREFLDEYVVENDSILRFLHEQCDVEPGRRIETGVAYQAYRAWMVNEGFTLMSSSSFGRGVCTHLKRLFPYQKPGTKNGSGSSRIYRGFALRSVAQQAHSFSPPAAGRSAAHAAMEALFS